MRIPSPAVVAAAADFAERARDDARRILSGSDYRPAEPPRPFRAPLRWLGERLAPLGRPFSRAFDWMVDDPLRFLPAAVAVAVAAALVALRVAARRSPLGRGEKGATRPRDGGESPEVLERAADACERAGDWAGAVRHRFRAGLLRLDAAGALAYRPSLTAGAATAAVASPTLAQLAATFDQVAYGGATASAVDAHDAREGWRAVLEEQRR